MRKFWCPECGAGPGKPCVVFDEQGVPFERGSNHMARRDKAERVISRTLLNSQPA